MPFRIHSSRSSPTDKTAVHTGGHAYGELAPGAAALDLLVDAGYPRRHDLAALVDAVRVEVVGGVVELELEAVYGVAAQRLLDDGEALLAHLLVGEVEAVEASPARVDAALSAYLQVLVVEAEV